MRPKLLSGFLVLALLALATSPVFAVTSSSEAEKAYPYEMQEAYALVFGLSAFLALFDVVFAFRSYSLTYLLQAPTVLYCLFHGLIGWLLFWVGLSAGALSDTNIFVSAIFVGFSVTLLSKAQLNIYGSRIDIGERMEKAEALFTEAIRENIRLKQEDFASVVTNYYAGRLDVLKQHAQQCLRVFSDERKDDVLSRIKVSSDANEIFDLIKGSCGERSTTKYLNRELDAYPSRDLLALRGLSYRDAEALGYRKIQSRKALYRVLRSQDLDEFAANNGLSLNDLNLWFREAQRHARRSKTSLYYRSAAVGSLAVLVALFYSYGERNQPYADVWRARKENQLTHGTLPGASTPAPIPTPGPTGPGRP